MTLGTAARPARCSPGPGPRSALAAGGLKEPSSELAALLARPSPRCLASCPLRPGANCFSRRGETGRDSCAHRAEPRACRLSPRSCPASSAFFPSHPSLLGTGLDPVPPFPWGAGGGEGPRCAGAGSACAERRGERCPAPRHGRARARPQACGGGSQVSPFPATAPGGPEGSGVTGRRPPPPLLPGWVLGALCPSRWAVVEPPSPGPKY